MVATLLTLTDSLIIVVPAACRCCVSRQLGCLTDLGDLVGPARRSPASIAALEHDAQQRLGARVADQQPAMADQAAIRRASMTSAMAGTRRQIASLAHADVDQHLRIGHQLSGQRRQRPSGDGHHPQHAQRRGQAVAGEQVVGEDHVAGLLAAEREAARGRSPPSRTCRPPACAEARCRDSSSASSSPMLLITVATTVSPRRRPSAFSCSRAHQHHARRRRPAGRARRRGSRGRRRRRRRRRRSAPRLDHARRHRLRVRRPATEVDVAAVGRGAQSDRRRSPAPRTPAAPRWWSRRWRSRRRAARRQAAGVGQHLAQVIAVAARPGPWPAAAGASPASTDQLSSAISCSTRRSSSSVNFWPPPEKTLMPLSSKGLCEAEITAPSVTSLARVR